MLTAQMSKYYLYDLQLKKVVGTYDFSEEGVETALSTVSEYLSKRTKRKLKRITFRHPDDSAVFQFNREIVDEHFQIDKTLSVSKNWEKVRYTIEGMEGAFDIIDNKTNEKILKIFYIQITCPDFNDEDSFIDKKDILSLIKDQTST